MVLGVESNLGVEADHHEAYILAEKLSQQVCVLHETHRTGTEGVACGLHTSNVSKSKMAFLASWDLNRDRIRIADNFTCVGSTSEKVLRELRGELSVFSRLVEPATKQGGAPRVIFTGKHASATDDLAIAFQLYWLARNFYYSRVGVARYAEFHAMQAVA